MKAPFKRGTRLVWRGRTVKYVKWMGFERAALIIVEDPNSKTVAGRRFTVHVDEVKPA